MNMIDDRIQKLLKDLGYYLIEGDLDSNYNSINIFTESTIPPILIYKYGNNGVKYKKLTYKDIEK
jgi:hypothetical protein